MHSCRRDVGMCVICSQCVKYLTQSFWWGILPLKLSTSEVKALEHLSDLFNT